MYHYYYLVHIVPVNCSYMMLSHFYPGGSMGLYFVMQLFIGVVASVNPISSFPQALQNGPCRQCLLVSHQHETGTSRGISNYDRKTEPQNDEATCRRSLKQPVAETGTEPSIPFQCAMHIFEADVAL
ncbi:unnamed protein product [Lepidochelys kempii]